MLLAAGLGTRLRPLTDRIPKALLEIGGVPMLEQVARRLIAAGADRLIINTHHLGEQIERFVAERENFGVEVRFSREEGAPLETGGGLLRAAPHFRRDAPFFLHNTDILSDLPLREMYEAHLASGALATVAVMDRSTSRYLLFDEEGLCGRTDERKRLEIRARPAVGAARRLAFGGVHVVSPEIFELITERGAFSILDPYLRLIGEGHRILPFRVDGYSWQDIGKPEQLEQARQGVGGRGA
ncbi:MAG TPA: nucleotidyltransferase family protein [Longimicrobiaceae bacterium]|nr:nucleotidyltransferase family protein [Longimicrobiaceae bacterium]